MRNFKRHTGATDAWGNGVTKVYPDQPHSVLTVSDAGVTLGMVVYTGSADSSEWLARSGKASFHSTTAPHLLHRTGRT